MQGRDSLIHDLERNRRAERTCVNKWATPASTPSSSRPERCRFQWFEWANGDLPPDRLLGYQANLSQPFIYGRSISIIQHSASDLLELLDDLRLAVFDSGAQEFARRYTADRGTIVMDIGEHRVVYIRTVSRIRGPRHPDQHFLNSQLLRAIHHLACEVETFDQFDCGIEHLEFWIWNVEHPRTLPTRTVQGTGTATYSDLNRACAEHASETYEPNPVHGEIVMTSIKL